MEYEYLVTIRIGVTGSTETEARKAAIEAVAQDPVGAVQGAKIVRGLSTEPRLIKRRKQYIEDKKTLELYRKYHGKLGVKPK
jgi:hypothetical protein